MEKSETVFILGASNKVERFSNQAKTLLQSYKHKVVLINPKLDHIEGEKVYPDINSAPMSCDTLTVYLKPSLSGALLDQIIQLAPKRIIFNPGSENPEMYKNLENNGIKVQEDCTLVLLRNDKF